MAEEGTGLCSESNHRALPQADSCLLIELRAGDVDAEHRFIRDYYPGVYRYLLYLTAHRETAEDLTQETFLQAWRHLDQFQGRAPLRLWLHQIARREFLRARRYQRPSTSLEEIAEFPESRLDGWTDEVEMRVLLSGLPEEQQEVMILHTLEGYSSGEIARITQAPASTVRDRLRAARARLARALGPGDLAYLNERFVPMRQWAWLPLDQMHALVTRLTLGSNSQKEGSAMERREFLRQAAVGAAGLMLTEPEKEIVDSRLTQKVTCAFKATALSDLCEKLKADTGIQVTAGPSVADEKVTLFCERLPLRDVMRQLSRPFGYTWLRSGIPGKYRYELVQDLRSQLLEEELRNRDRNQALLALETEIERYRPFLSLSPDEAFARIEGASPVDKPLLEKLAKNGWGPIQMYFRLSHQDLTALRAGQRITFSAEPRPGERLLPPELAQGIIQCQRSYRLLRDGNRFHFASDLTDPRALDLVSIPEVRAITRLEMPESEVGQFTLMGSSGFFTTGWDQPSPGGDGPSGARSFSSSGPWAAGGSAASHTPDNRRANARLASDPSFRAPVTLNPRCSCGHVPGRNSPDPESPESRATTADVLEALHHLTGKPLIADYHTRLYPVGTVSPRNVPLIEAINQVSDTMGLRWRQEGEWLQFREASFFNDRLKEVPNRFLKRWSEARRQSGALTLDDLVEIAQLPDSQLDSADMAEGARLCFGLAEWDLGRNHLLRPHLRFLAAFTPEQRRMAMSAEGLPFTRMSLVQQQQFIRMSLQEEQPLEPLEELAGSALRVDYSLPGQYEWRVPGPWWLQWVVPLASGRSGSRVLRPCVRERTREAALSKLRQIDPHVRKAVVEAAGRADPRLLESPPDDDAQIQPTQLKLAIICIPGASNARAVYAVFDGNEVFGVTQ